MVKPKQWNTILLTRQGCKKSRNCYRNVSKEKKEKQRVYARTYEHV